MSKKTIRLLMPQWQGGNNPNYAFGAELLAWLAPENDQPLINIPVEPYNGKSLEKEKGFVGKKQLLEQLKSAHQIIDAHNPDRVVMFGGDCLVEQAPFAYLNEKYDGELGLLWIDAHSDLVSHDGYDNAHSLPLGNLLGEGDEEFAKEVSVPLDAKNVFIAGLEDTTEKETEMIQRRKIRTAGTKELLDNPEYIKEWIKENDIKHLAIHLDLDVLDPKAFRSLLPADPDLKEELGFPTGSMLFPQLIKLVNDISVETDVVGLGITEHLPWDSINLKNLLGEMPILNK